MTGRRSPRRRPFGSLRKLPSGRWQVRYSDANGNRRVADETYASEAEAEDALTLIQADIIRGTWRDPAAGLITFREWSDEYMAGALHKRARTKYKDQSILRSTLLPVFGDMPLASIEPRHVRAFVAKLAEEYAPSTVDTKYSLFRTIMNAAVDIDLLMVTPCRGVHLPEELKKAKRRVTIDELAKLAAAVPVRYRAMIWLAGIMGLRWSELAGLKVGRISFLGTPSITVDQALADVGGRLELDRTKNLSSERTLPLPPLLRDLLAEHLAREGRAGDLDALVFTAPRGGMLGYSDFHKTVWRPAIKKAKLDGLKFHALRESAAGLLRQLGMHTQLIAKWLGHSTDSEITSKRYGWVPDEVDLAAAEALNEALRAALWHDSGTDAAASGDE